MTTAGGPSVLRTLRDLSPSLWLLLVGMFVNRLGTLVQFYLVLYLVGRGFEEYTAGIALGAYGVGSVIGVLLGGAITDRLGYRWTITLSMAGAGVLTAALLHVPGIGLVVVTAAIIGVLAQAYRPASSALMVELTPERQHVMVFAVYRLAFNLGSTAGPLLGALLITYSYDLVFYLDAVSSVVFALFALRLPRTTAAEGPAGDGAAGARGTYLTVLRDRRYLLYLAAVFLYAVVYIQHLAALPLQVTADGHGPGLYAALLSTNAALIIALELPLTRFVQRLPGRLAVAAGIALVGVGMTLNVAGAVAAVFVVAMLVWTAGEMICSPTLLAYPGRLAPAASRSRYVAASGVAMQIGFAAGPALGVALYTVWPAGLWWACAVVGLVGAAAALAGMVPLPGDAGRPGDEREAERAVGREVEAGTAPG